MTTLKATILLAIFFASLLSHSQDANFVWAQKFGGNLNDNCSSVSDFAGNVYRIQNGITKHNGAGTQAWTYTAQYNPLDLSFDASGDVYIVGAYSGTLDLDHGPGTNTVAAVGGVDICILKINGSNGNFIWGKSMGSSNNDFDAVIDTDPAGNIYLGGSFSGVYDVDPGPATLNFTATATDFFISKLNSSGTLQWAQQFTGNSGGWVGSIDADVVGDIYFSGAFSGTRDFDPGAAVASYSTSSLTDNDMYIAKLDASGNFIWTRQIGASGSDYVQELRIGLNGNLYCTGLFTGMVDFDSGPATLSLNSGTVSNAFVAEFTNNGTPNWVRNYSGFFIAAMDLDQNNGICLTGQFKTGDFDPGVGTFSMTAIDITWPDIFITKLSTAGNFLWAKKFGGFNEDGINSLTIDGSNNIHLAGRFKTTCDFNPNAGTYELTAAGGNFNYDAFMLKLCQTPALYTLDGNTLVCSGSIETYSVSAFTDAQFYTWNLPTNWTGTSTTNIINVTATSVGGTIALASGNACGISTKKLKIDVDLCAGIDQQMMSTNLVYPNPSSGQLKIAVSKQYSALLLNSLGQTLMETTFVSGNNELNLSEYKKGIYFIRLIDATETKQIKVILH